MKYSIVVLGMLLALGLTEARANAGTGTKADCEASGRAWEDGRCVSAEKVDCDRAGACGVDGLDAAGWTKVTRESSGCAATEADGKAYDEAAARVRRLDRRSSSAFNLMRRYQRLCLQD